MKIVIAPDSFKGCLTALEAGRAIEKGVRRAIPGAETVVVPIADGGEGTVESITHCGHGRFLECEVTGPMGKPVTAVYGMLPQGLAVMEMSAASGLTLVPPDERNPMKASTYGTGEMLLSALDNGARSILLGIGGSATNDGGMGMARALGVSFKDDAGNELGLGGGELLRLRGIDTRSLDPRILNCKIYIASDVNNPLCGELGASKVFGPQKGATPEMAALLDKALENYSKIIYESLGVDISNAPGSGAAGGLGAGLLAFCGAEMRPGIDMVLEFIDFGLHLDGADLVLTGEGRIDGQTAFGKAPCGVAKKAKSTGGIPVIALTGCIGDGAEKVYSQGIDAIFAIANGPISLEESQKKAAPLLESAAESVLRAFLAGKTS